MPAALASPIARPSVGRTFIVAISLLGIVALAQLGAVGWVFVHSFQSLTERAKMGSSKKLAGEDTAPAGDLATTDGNETLNTKDPLLEGDGAPELASTDPIPPPPKPVPVSPSKIASP